MSGILVVEDDPDLRSILEHVLVDRGYIVYTAESASIGWQQFRQHRFLDLAYLDVQCAEKGSMFDGIQLFDSIRVARPDFPAIFASGDIGTYTMDHINMRSPYFLRKPFAPPQLLDLIRMVLLQNGRALAR